MVFGMHKEIAEYIAKAKNTIFEELHKNFPDTYEQLYKFVLGELAKGWKDLDDEKGYKYYEEVSDAIYERIAFPPDHWDFNNALGAIGLILNRQHTLLSRIANEERLDKSEFKNITAEEVYMDLVGDTARDLESET